MPARQLAAALQDQRCLSLLTYDSIEADGLESHSWLSTFRGRGGSTPPKQVRGQMAGHTCSGSHELWTS